MKGWFVKSVAVLVLGVAGYLLLDRELVVENDPVLWVGYDEWRKSDYDRLVDIATQDAIDLLYLKVEDYEDWVNKRVARDAAVGGVDLQNASGENSYQDFYGVVFKGEERVHDGEVIDAVVRDFKVGEFESDCVPQLIVDKVGPADSDSGYKRVRVRYIVETLTASGGKYNTAKVNIVYVIAETTEGRQFVYDLSSLVVREVGRIQHGTEGRFEDRVLDVAYNHGLSSSTAKKSCLRVVGTEKHKASLKSYFSVDKVSWRNGKGDTDVRNWKPNKYPSVKEK